MLICAEELDIKTWRYYRIDSLLEPLVATWETAVQLIM